MCGIAGTIGKIDPDDAARVRRMTAIESHRGPDASRIECLPGAVLGHRRLSIIDLTERGIQPMRSNRGAWLVFNGEIYNYRELRKELAQTYPFRTDTDSEVLLAAWERWGEGCLDRLNGMFAFCLYQPDTRTAFFARDRFGQKPLYLVERDGKLLFASEVKALLAAGVPARPNRAVWTRYLLRASYDDSADSFFEGVRQLMPGECAWFDPARGISYRRYYDLSTKVHRTTLARAEAAAHVRDLLIDVARLHMRADVPVGIALSGGLDSSALLASLELAGELHDGVKCFSVDFGEDLTERPWIEAAATHHHLQSQLFHYSREAFRADVRPMMWHLEGPIGGLMNCALAPVMAGARAAGIRVIQDGTGLDEAFGGYRNHHDLYLGLLIDRCDPGADAAIRDYSRNWQATEEGARSAASRALANVVTAIDGTQPVQLKLLDPRLLAELEEADSPRANADDALHRALIDYLQGSKIPRNNRMKDRLSMAYGLELRLPFLDYRLVEFALSLPAELYFSDGRSKAIVRDALEGVMDDRVRLAAKRSIQAPQGAWLKSEPMRTYVADIIASESFAERGLFDVGAAKEAFARFCQGEYENSFFVWQWINVEEWHRMFVDGDPLSEPDPLCREIACLPQRGDLHAQSRHQTDARYP
jgi:asparagine synthase (glutamine-hydrolysing)